MSPPAVPVTTSWPVSLRRWLASGLLVAALTGCAAAPVYRASPPDRTHARGSVERVEYLRSYSALRLRVMLLLARLPEHIPVNHGVDLYRVSYWTAHLGQPELASALVALPRGVPTRGTVEWLNGTNPTRAESPSMGGLTGVLVAASFAGSGFLLVAPDYVGLGLSTTYHPYLYAATTADTAIDLLRAAQQMSAGLGVSWQPTTLLVGFSQGAYSTAVVQRALERTPEPGITLRAAAALAPPLNLAEISVPFALEGRSTASSLYLAFIVASYARIYGHPIATLFTDQSAPLAATLFDGTHESDEIRAKLPARPREMFRPGVVDALLAGRPSWFRDALTDNEAYRWAPSAPLRLYYGDHDVDVSAEDPRRAAAEMRARGGDVSLVSVGPYDHRGVAFRGVPRVRKWFIELTAPASASTSERTR